MGPRSWPTPIPVDGRRKAIVRGIERRARTVAVAPGWVRAALYGRTLIQPVVERQVVRKGVADILADAARTRGRRRAAATPRRDAPSRAER